MIICMLRSVILNINFMFRMHKFCFKSFYKIWFFTLFYKIIVDIIIAHKYIKIIYFFLKIIFNINTSKH